ncbi:hypothetical protein DL96DRAFT_1589207 [Flagelloscypha sp. PMI_526]|nr:hypothetical protein DL96DRAFT_1589207 [Flagelloscypha sp. PMI_526]
MDALVTALHNKQFVNYVTVASDTVFLYDYILTLPLEIRVIWPAPWTPSKMLFLSCRYLVFVACFLEGAFFLLPGIGSPKCEHMLAAMTILRGLCLLASEAIFTLRTNAINENCPKLGRCLWTLYGLVLSCWFIVDSQLIKKIRRPPGIPDPPGWSGCLVEFPPHAETLSLFGLVMAFEFAIAVFMTAPLYNAYRLNLLSKLRLYRVVYLDAVLFSLLLLLFSLVNMVTIAIPNVASHALPMFLLVMHSTFACRVMLHIRGSHRPLDPSDSLELVSPAVFASRSTTRGEEEVRTSFGRSDAPRTPDG